MRREDTFTSVDNCHMAISTDGEPCVEIVNELPSRRKTIKKGFFRTKSIEELNIEGFQVLGMTTPVQRNEFIRGKQRFFSVGTMTDGLQDHVVMMDRAGKEWQNCLDTVTACKFEELRSAHHK